MIICTETDDGLTPFERKYLFTEARGEKKNRKNVRQISIDMSNKKGKTTINGAEADTDDIDVDDTDDIDLSELDDETNVSDTSVDPDDDSTDDSAGDDMDIDLEDPEDSNMGDDDGSDSSDNVSTEPDNSDDSGEDDSSSNSDSNGTVDDGENDDTEGSDDIAVEPDDSDSDSGSDDSGAGDSSSDDSGDSDDSSEESPEDKEEAVHKQALFSKFQNLYESIGNYNAKLDEIVGKTDITNHNYKEINDNLKQLRDFLYDYMIIKFKDASYTESMLFYQRAIAVVNLSLDMLENVRKSEADK